MTNIETSHPMNYRKEIVGPFFERVLTTESCTIVGASSMGKTRLMNFIKQENTQAHFLGSRVEDTLLLHVDCKRAVKIEGQTNWTLYEIILAALHETTLVREDLRTIESHLYEFHRTVAVEPNELIALRNLEKVVKILVEKEGKKICFIFDDFDLYYSDPKFTGFSQLRALRDRYKKHLSFVLLMRHFPSVLREANDDEEFYELVTIFEYGLKPYTKIDSYAMLDELENRRGNIPDDLKEKIWKYSGGHSGLINRLVAEAGEDRNLFSSNHEANLVKLLNNAEIAKECKRLWNSLSQIDQAAYLAVLREEVPHQEGARHLMIKGLLRKNGLPSLALFHRYLEKTKLT